MATDGKQISEGREAPDWGTAAPRAGIGDIVAIEAAIAVVAGGLVALLVDPAVGIGVGALLGAGAVGGVARRGSAALRSLGARAPQGEESARLANLVAGLCGDLGIEAPEVLIVDRGGPNAMVVQAAGSHIAVTKALLNDYSRTETEAAVAHCLVRLACGEARRTTVLTGRGPWRPEPVGTALDGRAAALTRYPPGLIKALTKAAPQGGSHAALWMVGDGDSHEPIEARIAALSDL